MIENTKKFVLGTVMMITFIVVLVLMFTPMFDGKNVLEFSDDLYNSISKGSAYYIPLMEEKISKFNEKRFEVQLSMESDRQATETVKLLRAEKAQAEVNGKEITVSGDLGKLLANCLVDADAMYHNASEKLHAKYNYDARQITYNWWYTLKDLDKKFTNQKKFKEAEIVALVSKKVVETSYNYYEIEPQKLMDKLAIVVFSLIFYVVYTIWYGFAILYLFEGFGLKLGH